METATYFLLSLGTLLLLLAAVGLLRFPDTLTRMAAVTKATTLGSFFFALAAWTHFQNGSVLFQVFLMVLILFIGRPLSTHLLSRARVRYADKGKLVLKRDDHQKDFGLPKR